MSDKKVTKVTLELDLKDSALTIENVFASLAVSDRKLIAEEILLDWIKEPSADIQKNLVTQLHIDLMNHAKIQVEEIVKNNEKMQDLMSAVAMQVVDRLPEIMMQVISNWLRNEFRYKMDDLVTDPTYQLSRDLMLIKQKLGLG